MYRLLCWLTDADLADSIIGDLEQGRRRQIARSDVGATFWFWREALTIIVYAWRELMRSTWMNIVTRGFGVGGPGRFPGECRRALRSLRRTPWYALTVIGVMALGVGLATTVFAVVDGVLFKPLPYAAARELFLVQGAVTHSLVRMSTVAARDVRDWSLAVPEISVAAYRDQMPVRLASAPDAPAYGVAAIDRRFFDVLGIAPLLGGFHDDDFAVAPPIHHIVISYGFWQQQLGGALDVLGRRIDTGAGDHLEIAGVLTRDFVFPQGHPAWLIPLDLNAHMVEPRDQRTLSMIARIPESASVSSINARLSATASALTSDFPVTNVLPGAFNAVTLRPLTDVPGSGDKPTFALVAVAAALLIVLACVQLTGLVASRNLDRTRELAMRRALGASTCHLWTMLTAEVAILIGGGLVSGLLITRPLLAATVTFLPPDVFLIKDAVIDGRVIGFAVFVTLMIVIVVPLLALRSLRAPAATLIAGTGTSTGRVRTARHFAVVAVQSALALLLALAGTFVVGGLLKAWSDGPGYPTSNAIYADVRISGTNAWSRERIDTLMQTVREEPGVDVAVAFEAPFMNGSQFGSQFSRPEGAIGHANIEVVQVTAGFFDAFHLPATSGQLPADVQLARGDQVAVVSESVARMNWPGRSAVGQLLFSTLTSDEARVVAVVPDVRLSGLDRESPGLIFLPFGHAPWGSAAPTMYVRTARAEAQFLPALVAAVTRFDPSMTVVRAGAVDDALADSVRHSRFQSWLFGVFGAAGLTIVGAGILGLTAMSTNRRRREMGVRVALGGTPAGIVGLVLREQAVPVAAGLAAGSVCCMWLVLLTSPPLFAMVVCVIAMALVALTAAAGTIAPAVRLSRVDPVKALRVE